MSGGGEPQSAQIVVANENIQKQKSTKEKIRKALTIVRICEIIGAATTCTRRCS